MFAVNGGVRTLATFSSSWLILAALFGSCARAMDYGSLGHANSPCPDVDSPSTRPRLIWRAL